MKDAPSPKNLSRICPLLSSAITYEVVGKDGTRTRVHDLARSSCLRGDCEMWDVGRFMCVFKVVQL